MKIPVGSRTISRENRYLPFRQSQDPAGKEHGTIRAFGDQ
jgi:hypothetical protein